ncbi:hypothetical protein Back2_02200 [Nocardioides baekrokdamisoli]|uniref:Fibronectin type-III domain-containing protein n=1 Tax=Nocardioides baekrokdamisoli TaxID=1804624 RepID=A0A3G9IUP4_9ACTN|nr:hypothetical protein [Nocardioides baekrokdamisoli]BBH15933.1 hypothetical protein Back2_02200 [Nocardioides baekrokdamisoli]
MSAARGWARRWNRPFVVVAAAMALILAITGGALAYWTSTGSGSRTASTGTLAAPTAVAGSQTAGTGTVTVTWTGSSGSPAPTGYYVTRTNSGNVTSAACGTTPTSTVGTTTCQDTSVPLGTYTYAVVAVYHSWTASSAPSGSVAVVQSSQAITFTSNPASPAYNGTYTVTATGGGSGNAVTFTSATSSVCTVSGSTVSFVGVGSCTINANQAGSTYYTAAPQKQQSFSVAQASQTITFTSTAPGAATYNGATYTVTATGGASGNAVTFTSATTPVCTLSGATVSFVGVGTCTINANQTGNTNYAAAAQAQQSFSVAKASQTITFTSTAPGSATVGGATYTVTATGGASGNAVTFSIDGTSAGSCTISGAVVTFAHVGTCVVDANQAGNANYNAANQVQQSIAVGKGSQAVTFTSTAPGSAAVGGATYTATATGGGSGNAVTFTIDAASAGACTIAGAVVTFVHAGTCVLDANQAGNTDYLAAAQTQQSFAVAKGAQTVTITSTAPGGATVGGATYTATGTGGGSGNAVTFATSTPTICTSGGTNGATITFVGAGTCTVQASQAGNSDYLSGSATPQSFTVAKGNQTVSFTSTAPNNVTVGTTYTPTATATSGLTVAITIDATTSSVCSISGGVVTYNTLGTCKVDANQAGDANWNGATQVQQSITVSTKGSQTVSFTSTAPNNVTVGTTYTPTATATSGLTVAITIDATTSSVCSLSGGVVTFNTSGICKVDANQAGNANWNTATQVQQSVTVSGAKVNSIVLGGNNGTAGKGDTVTIQFAGQMDATKFCSTWTNSGTQTLSGNGVVTVTITASGGTNILTVTASGCTVNIGQIDLHTTAYVTSGPVAFSGNGSNASSVSLDTSGQLQIKLGSVSSGSAGSGAVATEPSYTPASGLSDVSGNALSTTTVTDSSGATRF